jgi:hypothetical protein
MLTATALLATLCAHNELLDIWQVLKMARKVGTEKMVSALTDSVKPRMGAAGAGPLLQFQTMLLNAVNKEGAANKGMQFGFVCKPGCLCVSIDGKDAGTVNR